VSIEGGEGGITDLAALFEENLVVLAQGYAEDDRGDVLEAMDPLLPLTPLTADVKHAAK